VSRHDAYRVAWSCDAGARSCAVEVSGPHKKSFTLRLPYGTTFAIDDQQFQVPPEVPDTVPDAAVAKPLAKVLFDIGADDIKRIEQFYSAWGRGRRETAAMVAALDDYAGGRGKRHNLDLILASWSEAQRRAELVCRPARDAALGELGSQYSLRQMLSVLHPPHAYWEARKAIHEREEACKQVEHIMGLGDGRVLVWLTSSVEKWPEGQPKPWEIVREQIELVDAAEEITRDPGGDER
jgi:hypothetical protein